MTTTFEVIADGCTLEEAFLLVAGLLAQSTPRAEVLAQVAAQAAAVDALEAHYNDRYGDYDPGLYGVPQDSEIA
jgi:hypothetical protein